MKCRIVVAGALRLRDHLPVVFKRDAVGLRAATDSGIEGLNRGDLVLCKLEIKDGEVPCNARASLTSGSPSGLPEDASGASLARRTYCVGVRFEAASGPRRRSSHHPSKK